jgi:hypothetical protein
LDHLLECAPAKCAGTADGIVYIEFYQAKAVFGDVGFQSLFLVTDGLFLAVGGAADVADSPVTWLCRIV